jgi:hypothetical protein
MATWIKAALHWGFLLGLGLRLCVPPAAWAQEPKLRCGWFENPTPGNAWLTDRDGEWLIGVQGGMQADGDWPRFRKGEWVARQASYGYGCACLRLVADPATKEVKNILSAKARPLKACREDPALKKPGD